MEEGEWRGSEEGTPQGGLVSPVLANIYLHHVFDQWAQRWRKQEARGAVIIVRYADDFVVGFEHRQDADRSRASPWAFSGRTFGATTPVCWTDSVVVSQHTDGAWSAATPGTAGVPPA
jgi:hypothetical protein